MREDNFENTFFVYSSMILRSLVRAGVIQRLDGPINGAIVNFPYVWYQENEQLTILFKNKYGTNVNLTDQKLEDAVIEICTRIFMLDLLRYAKISIETFSAYKWLSCAVLGTKQVALSKLEDTRFLRKWAQHPPFHLTPRVVSLEDIKRDISSMILIG